MILGCLISLKKSHSDSNLLRGSLCCLSADTEEEEHTSVGWMILAAHIRLSHLALQTEP